MMSIFDFGYCSSIRSSELFVNLLVLRLHPVGLKGYFKLCVLGLLQAKLKELCGVRILIWVSFMESMHLTL